MQAATPEAALAALHCKGPNSRSCSLFDMGRVRALMHSSTAHSIKFGWVGVESAPVNQWQQRRAGPKQETRSYTDTLCGGAGAFGGSNKDTRVLWKKLEVA